ncbi:MAG: 50S ribosomal protein L6 [Rhodobacteraceae bacterium]|nr:50S ribosomal protein L6 [Paracoccaceae bacterium]
MSRIGKMPVVLPSDVVAELDGQTVAIKGPKGRQQFTASDDILITLGDNAIAVAPRGGSKRARQQWGTARTRIANMVVGVTQGFRRELEINGVGYRAQMQGNALKLSLGLSHEVVFEPPADVQISAPRPSEIVIEGTDAQRVGQVAANIRRWRRPEPYKGKGIKHKNEFIFRKEGKKK